MTIITSSRQTYRDCSINGAENDSVELILDNEFVKLPVDSVLILILPHNSGIWENAGYGAFIGGVLGTFINIIPDKEEKKSSCPVVQGAWESLKFLEGPIIGIMAGFAAGALIGAISGGEEKCDLTKLTTNEKINVFKKFSTDTRK